MSIAKSSYDSIASQRERNEATSDDFSSPSFRLIRMPPPRLVTRLFFDYRPHLWLAVALVSVVAAAGIAQLNFEDDPQNLYRQHNEDFAELERLEAEFGSFDDELLVLVAGERLFSHEGLSSFRALIDRLRQIDGVTAVFSMADTRRAGSRAIPLIPYSRLPPSRYEKIKQDARDHPLVGGHFLSMHNDTALVLVQLDGHWPTIQAMAPVVAEIREVADRFNTESPLRASISGMPIVRLDSLVSVQREQLKFSLLALLLSSIISWLVFRQVAAVVLATAAPAAGTFWALGLMGWLGVEINGFNMLLPTLVLVVGFTDALHLVVDIRASLAGGRSRPQAATAAAIRLGPACFLTSLTTAIGFGSLGLSSTVSIREFGWVCACGTALSFVAVIVLIPLLASSPWGRFLVAARPAAVPGRHVQRTGSTVSRTPSIRRLARLLRFPRLRIVATGLVIAACAPLPGRLTPDVRSTEAIPDASETIQTLQQCDRAIGGSLPVFVVVQWPEGTDFLTADGLAALDELHKILEDNQQISRPLSILSVLQLMPGQHAVAEVERFLARFPAEVRARLVQRELRKLLISARVPDVGAAALQPTWQRLEADLAKFEVRHPGYRVTLTGRTVVAGRNLRQIILDLARSLALAAIVIVVVLTLVFRSLMIGLLSIIPNMLPLLANTALLQVCGYSLQLTSVVTFSLCLGIAVDDTIHFLMRFRRERQGGWPVGQAILRTYASVGFVLIATSAILTSGFAVIALSSVPALRLFAGLTCTAMGAALVADLLILPALLQCCASRDEVR